MLALQGFEYDGPAGRIGFRPVLNAEDHKSFFTAAEGYGLFSQTRNAGQLKATIDLKEGQLRLTEVILAAEGKQPKYAQVKLGGTAVAASLDVKDGELRLALQSPVTLNAGQQLDIQVELA